ncbi:unnamed protein product [Bursaphelenchus okinawaensis]|uniref:Bicarbonate transporter-like transmembrane domain-containing protein n=1 Tax=Bursaphelenchus okinawaensis TaxID=465554 RepID=A0A811K125_9BILA|nr:unnamed protein product [Bursaphelenchus okinawaensis]CAG9088707.1 unnamed protein product [Bursaphelenchus okinawaensis]
MQVDPGAKTGDPPKLIRGTSAEHPHVKSVTVVETPNHTPTSKRHALAGSSASSGGGVERMTRGVEGGMRSGEGLTKAVRAGEGGTNTGRPGEASKRSDRHGEGTVIRPFKDSDQPTGSLENPEDFPTESTFTSYSTAPGEVSPHSAPSSTLESRVQFEVGSAKFKPTVSATNSTSSVTPSTVINPTIFQADTVNPVPVKRVVINEKGAHIRGLSTGDITNHIRASASAKDLPVIITSENLAWPTTALTVSASRNHKDLGETNSNGSAHSAISLPPLAPTRELGQLTSPTGCTTSISGGTIIKNERQISPKLDRQLHGYGSSATLLSTTQRGNHLNTGPTPSRNPSVKSNAGLITSDSGAAARIKSLRRRISHTLLFVPEQRRVSTASGVSVTSCPTTEDGIDSDEGISTSTSQQQPYSQPTKRRYQPATQRESSFRQPLLDNNSGSSLSINAPARRKSIQPAAPCIGFPAKRTIQRTYGHQPFGRRSSQPEMNIAAKLALLGLAQAPASQAQTITGVSLNPPDSRPEVSLAKRVSWMSMKSLNDPMDPFNDIRKERDSGGITSRYDSRTNSQMGSVVQLNDTYELESDTPPIDTMSWSNLDEFDNVTLMYSKHEKIPMKDFGSEIRATMDIDHLLNKAVLLLDLQETSLEEIFAKIIHEMDIQEPEFTSEQVRSVLFTQDAGNQFHILSRTVQSICTTGTVGGTFDYDQTWICALCMLNTVQHRHVAIARLSHPTNLGRTMQDLRFIIIVIAPSRAKGTKTALETTRTFATLFADMDIRQKLVMAQTVDVFRATLLDAAKELALEQSQWRERKASIHLSEAKEQVFGTGPWYPMRGLFADIRRRKASYISDYLDGLRGHRTISKLFSTIIFLYFACLLPAIAFGVLNDDNTNGGINVRKVVFAQAVGGIFFSIFGGQPMIVLLTTVPLAIYIKVIYRISESLNYDFYAMYACVGLSCQMFLILYACTELCSFMKLATRSAEEMFSLFIAIAFTVESFRAIHHTFEINYNGCDDTIEGSKINSANHTLNGLKPCHRDTSVLYVLLMLGTMWMGMSLYNFRKTPYLTRTRREWLADYALPASVMIMTFLGAVGFSEIEKDMFPVRTEIPLIASPDIFSLPLEAYPICILLGFFLSFLFYMDQNITSAIVNNSQNKLKKGSAVHLDMFVVAILNCFLSIGGLPWMHGALPHSPLHLRALADVEERVAQGHVHEVIMNVRETRLASLIAHVLILMSSFGLIPYPIRWIPTSVLHGLFLHMAFTSLAGNEMVERLLLLITEQQAYPPTHYIRRVPQRKVHLFTACQLIQLVVLCAVGFSPYPFVEMVFPIVCFCFLPIRHILIPRLIDYKYLDALDGRH